MPPKPAASPPLTRLAKFLSRPWPVFSLLLALYAALLLPTISRQGISWDEQTDIGITRAYVDQPLGWLNGSLTDPSQTRLPMAGTALVYALTGARDLITGRLVSVIVGALTLLGAFQYARLRFRARTGLLAAGILAASPFFLSFARIAFTESDIYLACALIWLLVALARFEEQPTLSRAARVGLLLGLCISAKFTALSLLPAVWYAISRARILPAPDLAGRPLYLWSGWLLTISLIAWGDPLFGGDSAGGALRWLHAGFVLAGWALPLGWALAQRSQTPGRLPTAVFITALGWLTFLLVPPEHFANPNILRSLLWRAEHEMTLNPGFMLEAAGLHILSIFFKSSLLVGGGLLAGLCLALRQWRRSELRLPVLVILLYFGGLVLLPIAQTFYTIPLLPLLAVLAADQFWNLFERRRRAALALGAAAAIALAADLALCYPDFNLNGYQWLGARPLLGRSSIGYRSVVQTTSDGVQQSFEWLNRHARRGESVLAYVMPWHIVEASAPRPAYRIYDGMQAAVPDPDYVVVHINAQTWQGWSLDAPVENVTRYPYERAWLEANYTKVFSVPRAFGIEMASVWQRKSARGAGAR